MRHADSAVRHTASVRHAAAVWHAATTWYADTPEYLTPPAQTQGGGTPPQCSTPPRCGKLSLQRAAHHYLYVRTAAPYSRTATLSTATAALKRQGVAILCLTLGWPRRGSGSPCICCVVDFCFPLLRLRHGGCQIRQRQAGNGSSDSMQSSSSTCQVSFSSTESDSKSC